MGADAGAGDGEGRARQAGEACRDLGVAGEIGGPAARAKTLSPSAILASTMAPSSVRAVVLVRFRLASRKGVSPCPIVVSV